MLTAIIIILFLFLLENAITDHIRRYSAPPPPPQPPHPPRRNERKSYSYLTIIIIIYYNCVSVIDSQIENVCRFAFYYNNSKNNHINYYSFDLMVACKYTPSSSACIHTHTLHIMYIIRVHVRAHTTLLRTKIVFFLIKITT